MDACSCGDVACKWGMGWRVGKSRWLKQRRSACSCCEDCEAGNGFRCDGNGRAEATDAAEKARAVDI